ncbi:MAG: hypothetical protein ABJA66_09015 [Actinomycetota bacterium]
MAREVNNVQPFQDKVVKLVPTEIVGAYLVIMGIVAPTTSTDKWSQYSLISAFFFLLVLTPVYLWRVSGVSNVVQLAVSTVSYVVWIYTLSYPFEYWHWYNAKVGAVVLILWSLITPFFVTSAPPQPALPVSPAVTPPPTDNGG